MSGPCTVLIAAPDLLPRLKERVNVVNGELLVFSDGDVLRALEVITERRPSVVTLERLFAATPRGAALINRIKADPSLIHAEIRIISHDSDYTRVSPRKPLEAAPTPPSLEATTAAPVASAVAVPTPALDYRGTRRAPRFRITEKVDVVVDGNAAMLVDLSTVGAQVVSASVLKPNQRVRMALSDEAGSVRFNAVVAWAKFEIPPGSGPRYRAGLAFVDAHGPAVDAFCLRHKVP